MSLPVPKPQAGTKHPRPRPDTTSDTHLGRGDRKLTCLIHVALLSATYASKRRRADSHDAPPAKRRCFDFDNVREEREVTGVAGAKRKWSEPAMDVGDAWDGEDAAFLCAGSEGRRKRRRVDGGGAWIVGGGAGFEVAGFEVAGEDGEVDDEEGGDEEEVVDEEGEEGGDEPGGGEDEEEVGEDAEGEEDFGWGEGEDWEGEWWDDEDGEAVRDEGGKDEEREEWGEGLPEEEDDEENRDEEVAGRHEEEGRDLGTERVVHEMERRGDAFLD